MRKLRGEEYWWFFLKSKVEQKYRSKPSIPLLTLHKKVPNRILEIGDTYFKVRSDQGNEDRIITKKRIEFVLCETIRRGYFDSKVAEEYKELMNFDDLSGLKGANTSIIRALLVDLPFVEKDKKSSRIIFVPAECDKDKWGINC